MSSKGAFISLADRRKAVIADMVIRVGYPILMITLNHLVRAYRFIIVEDLGCYPSSQNTPLSIVLIHSQPLLIGLVSLVYCILSTRLYVQKNSARFGNLLSNHPNLTASRYLRLTLLAGVQLATTVPLATWVLAENLHFGIESPRGWDRIPSDFAYVEEYPAVLWRSTPEALVAMEFTRWAPIICAIVFFAFFGFASEARENYRSAIWTIARRMGFATSSGSEPTTEDSKADSPNHRRETSKLSV
ncbi:hypothetical protein FA13DRAFT_1775753 [Coprinellus micaceus]|uniref:STE3-domain-containing protein n=1 Tax=Coprinellus micaceus TaxID=71717 RepID=A0A4Y7T3N5_COPMI|nr:hypothetical protein FA13DRAFT_1775753 [Coprinellus micaceus]